MNRITRRQALLVLGSLLAGCLFPFEGWSQADATRTRREAAERGRRFLVSLFDPTIGLLTETRGSKVYKLYHDNYLAAKVLARTDPDLAGKLERTIGDFGVNETGKFAILFGEARNPLPFFLSRQVRVAAQGDKVIKTERRDSEIFTDWREYCDLLFLAAIAEAGQNRDKAVRLFELALDKWDRHGFADRVVRGGSHYETYKLALALIAAEKLGQAPPALGPIRDRLLALQDDEGGWNTAFDDQGKPFGRANVETTALAILALRGPD